MVAGFQAPLSFLNAYKFRRDIERALADRGAARLLVLEASSIVEIDFTASEILIEVIRMAHAAGVDFAIARLEFGARRGGAEALQGAGRAGSRPHVPERGPGDPGAGARLSSRPRPRRTIARPAPASARRRRPAGALRQPSPRRRPGLRRVRRAAIGLECGLRGDELGPELRESTAGDGGGASLKLSPARISGRPPASRERRRPPRWPAGPRRRRQRRAPAASPGRKPASPGHRTT